MKEFSIKNLKKAKTIIGQKITYKESILKIDQKGYIQDFSESEKMTLSYPTILSVKIGSTVFLD